MGNLFSLTRALYDQNILVKMVLLMFITNYLDMFVPSLNKSRKAVVAFSLSGKSNLKVLIALKKGPLVIIREGHFLSMSSNTFAFLTARVT